MISVKKIITYFAIFCAVIMCAAIVIISFSIKNFKKSDAYKTAVEDALNNPEIQVRVGKVTGFGYMVGGKITKASANISFKVEGEKSNLKVYYTLSKSSDGNWIIKELSWYP